jgi:hypothetical protein
MQPELSAGRVVHIVDERVLEELLREHAAADEFFAILSEDEGTYIQTASCGPGRFELEYRDGSAMRHYRCAESPLDLDGVVRAFRSYYLKNSTWRTAYAWQPMDRSTLQGRSVVVYTILTIVAVALLTLVIARGYLCQIESSSRIASGGERRVSDIGRMTMNQ